MDKKLKLGKLILTSEFLKDISANKKLCALMGEFIIISADINDDVVDYIAISDHFELISETDIIPQYNIVIHKGLDENYSWTVEKYKE